MWDFSCAVLITSWNCLFLTRYVFARERHKHVIDIPLYLRRLSGNILGRILFFYRNQDSFHKEGTPRNETWERKLPILLGRERAKFQVLTLIQSPRAVFVPFVSRPQTGSWGETRPETEVGCRISMHSPEIIALDDFRVVWSLAARTFTEIPTEDSYNKVRIFAGKNRVCAHIFSSPRKNWPLQQFNPLPATSF